MPRRHPRGPRRGRSSGEVALLFETRVGIFRIDEGVRGYALPAAKSCLIFPDVAATLDLAIEVDAVARTAAGWAFAEANRIAVDRKADRVTDRGVAQPIAPGTVRDTPEGWCVEAAALSAWLGISLDADRSNALLVVRSATELPVEIAQERRARVQPIRPVATVDPTKLPRVKLPYLLWRTPALDAVVTVNGVHDTRAKSELQTR